MQNFKKLPFLCGSPVFLTFGKNFHSGAAYEREARKHAALYERYLLVFAAEHECCIAPIPFSNYINISELQIIAG